MNTYAYSRHTLAIKRDGIIQVLGICPVNRQDDLLS